MIIVIGFVGKFCAKAVTALARSAAMVRARLFLNIAEPPLDYG
jgi:hypothetical protein